MSPRPATSAESAAFELTHSQNATERWRGRLQEKLIETDQKYPRCHCDFTGIETPADLTAMGAGCTSPQWCCGRLDAVRRKME